MEDKKIRFQKFLIIFLNILFFYLGIAQAEKLYVSVLDKETFNSSEWKPVQPDKRAFIKIDNGELLIYPEKAYGTIGRNVKVNIDEYPFLEFKINKLENAKLYILSFDNLFESKGGYVNVIRPIADRGIHTINFKKISGLSGKKMVNISLGNEGQGKSNTEAKIFLDWVRFVPEGDIITESEINLKNLNDLKIAATLEYKGTKLSGGDFNVNFLNKSYKFTENNNGLYSITIPADEFYDLSFGTYTLTLNAFKEGFGFDDRRIILNLIRGKAQIKDKILLTSKTIPEIDFLMIDENNQPVNNIGVNGWLGTKKYIANFVENGKYKILLEDVTNYIQGDYTFKINVDSNVFNKTFFPDKIVTLILDKPNKIISQPEFIFSNGQKVIISVKVNNPLDEPVLNEEVKIKIPDKNEFFPFSPVIAEPGKYQVNLGTISAGKYSCVISNSNIVVPVQIIVNDGGFLKTNSKLKKFYFKEKSIFIPKSTACFRWDEFNHTFTLWPELDDVALDTVFGFLKDCGFNTIRLAIDVPWEGLHGDLGGYANIEIINSLFHFLDKAEEFGFYVKPVLWWGKKEKEYSFEEESLWFSDYRLLEMQKKFITEFITPFKNDTRIIAWEIENEVSGSKDVLQWIKNICKHIRSIDNNHLITVSQSSLDLYWGSMYTTDSDVDFYCYHNYSQTEIADPGILVSAYQKYLSIFPQLTMIDEFGLMPQPEWSKYKEGRNLRAGFTRDIIWLTFLSGGAGVGEWYYHSDWATPQEFYLFSEITSQIDWQRFVKKKAPVAVMLENIPLSQNDFNMLLNIEESFLNIGQDYDFVNEKSDLVGYEKIYGGPPLTKPKKVIGPEIISAGSSGYQLKYICSENYDYMIAYLRNINGYWDKDKRVRVPGFKDLSIKINLQGKHLLKIYDLNEKKLFKEIQFTDTIDISVGKTDKDYVVLITNAEEKIVKKQTEEKTSEKTIEIPFVKLNSNNEIFAGDKKLHFIKGITYDRGYYLTMDTDNWFEMNKIEIERNFRYFITCNIDVVRIILDVSSNSILMKGGEELVLKKINDILDISKKTGIYVIFSLKIENTEKDKTLAYKIIDGYVTEPIIFCWEISLENADEFIPYIRKVDKNHLLMLNFKNEDINTDITTYNPDLIGLSLSESEGTGFIEQVIDTIKQWRSKTNKPILVVNWRIMVNSLRFYGATKEYVVWNTATHDFLQAFFHSGINGVIGDYLTIKSISNKERYSYIDVKEFRALQDAKKQ